MVITLFMKKLSRAAPNEIICLYSSTWERQEGKLTSYSEVVNYLLATYASDKIIADASMNTMNFKQPAKQSALEYVQELWMKAVRCEPVYNGYCLKEISVEGLKKSIRQSV